MAESGIRRGTWVLSAAGLAVLYYFSGSLALQFASVHESASPIWPPTGIAIAALYLLGRRMWPAIFAGAFLFNLQTSGDAVPSVGIAVGNTLEAWGGAWAARRFAGGERLLRTTSQALWFILLVCACAPVVSATVGTASLWAAGSLAASALPLVWFTWWAGDAVGALVVAPLLILWAQTPMPRWDTRRAAEASLLAAGLAASGALVLSMGARLEYVAIPFVLWAALRFSPRATLLVTFLLSLVALEATVGGRGPFVEDDPNEAFLLLQGFVAVTAVTGLLLATQVAQTAAVQAGVRSHRDELEARVQERTQRLIQSESALREAQEIAQLGSWQWDVGTNQVTWSEQLYRMFGVEQGTRVTFEAYKDLVHPDDRALVEAHVRTALEKREAYAFDHRIVRRDGRVRWIHSMGRVVTNADGQPVRLLGTAQDVTAARTSEERFRLLLESSPDALVIVDGSGRIVQVNEQTDRLFGYDRGELIGRPVEVLVPESSRPVHVGYRETYMQQPRPRPMGMGKDLKARRKDGTQIPVEISLSPLQTPDGALVISAIRDVTERRRADQEREELERLRQVNEFKTQFINMAAHELNTPLTPLKLQVHLLKAGIAGPLSDRQKKATAILDRSLERVSNLVQNMLDVGRIQSGRIVLRRGPLDLSAAIEETVEAFADVAREGKVALENHADRDLWVNGDAQRVGQVLFNLVSNALKFTPPGGRVWVETAVTQDHTTIRVRDNGLGLTADQIGRLFQPFSQVHETAQTAQRPGTGLGLFISRQLAQLHGGDLWAESEGPGRGATFVLSLPTAGYLAPPEEGLVRPQPAAAPPSPPARPDRGTAPAQPPPEHRRA